MKKAMIGLRITLSIYWKIIYGYIKPFLNWKFLLSFFLAWMVTNGWSYMALGLGIAFKTKWLITVASSYQAFLWLPCTPEKIVTIPIAIFFHKLFFPRDFKNIDKFNSLLAKEKKK